MMTWVVFLIALAVFIGLMTVAMRLSDYDHEIAALGMFSLGIVSGIMSAALLINALAWSSCAINLDIKQAIVEERRDVYIQLMDTYENKLSNQDVTASSSYLDLYEEIISFNTSVSRAKKWKNVWWAEGLLYDPSFATADVIPIN